MVLHLLVLLVMGTFVAKESINDNIFIITKKGEGYTYNVNELIDGNESDCEVTY